MHNKPTISLQSSETQGLRGEATIPGDKSISHRALMLSSQILGNTRISGLLEGEDVLSTARCMQLLGVRTDRLSAGSWEVSGVGVGGLKESSDILDMGNAGTGARLLMGLLAPYPFTSFFTGDASLRSRPMKRVITPLSEMGAVFHARSGERLPLALIGAQKPMPLRYRLPVASAQVKSAVLLAGLNTPGETTVIEPHATRDHTENMLEHFGFTVKRSKTEDGELAITLAGQQNPPAEQRNLTIPGDPSSAAFLIVAALITPNSDIMLPNICINQLRTGLFETLREMGAAIELINQRKCCGETVADMRVRSSELKGVHVPAARAPSMIDEYPVLAVAAAFAKGNTVMDGVGELRVKESDRLTAILDGLKACGVRAEAKGDTLTVMGDGRCPEGGALIPARMDHRIAMSFLVMGMASEKPVTIDDASSIDTSFPGFMELCNRLGARIEENVCMMEQKPLIIAIDGPAASGKGTIARRLAEQFGITYLDTGSLYRAVGLKLEYAGKDPHDLEAAIEAARGIEEKDLVNPRLRQEHIGKAASIVSAMPEVRSILLDFQRTVANSNRGAVLDGRDIGTVVCPNADIKFYLTATLEARARRRHRELQGQGIEVVYESVLDDLRERDERDSQRSIAPMRPAPEAIIIDTSTMDANSVFQKARQMVLEHLSRRTHAGAETVKSA